MSLVKNLIARGAGYLGYLVEYRMLIRRSVVIVITVAAGGYALAGLWIIFNRPSGHLTAEEGALIALFCGVNGVVFGAYAKSRNSEEEEEPDVDSDYRRHRHRKK